MGRHPLLAVLIIVLLGSWVSAAQNPDPFRDLLRKGDLAAITAALDKDPDRVGKPDAEGAPPLFWAAYFGQRAVVDLLLARGADPNAGSDFGLPLHAAAIGGHAEIIRGLVAKGAKPDAGGAAGIPPLVLAARRGQTASAAALLEAGASVDIRDSGGNTALLLAASFGHEDIVRQLMARRASVAAANVYGITALDAATREGHGAVVALLGGGEGQAPRPAARPSGPYLGQAPPGESRRLFAPGFVSTERRELNAVFTPDGRTFFFSRDRGPGGTGVFLTRLDGASWQAPALAPFSSADDVDMFVTADGAEVYFCSNRPTPGQAPSPPGAAEVRQRPPADIWVAPRQGDSWGQAAWLGPEVNHPTASDYYPTLTRAGVLYFSSNRPGGLGENDIYRTRRVDGRWTTPENLGPAVNSAGRDYDPFIAPDESYLIFASERPGGLGGADLYISVRSADGAWGKPANLGPAVNRETSEYTPIVSQDGRYLFFTSGTAGSDDLFWIDAAVVRKAVAAAGSR